MKELVARIIAFALRRKAVRAYLRYSERRGPMLADSITYRTLFSVFAGVLLGFSIAALWLAGNPDAWKALIDAVDNAIPGLVGEGGLIATDGIAAPASLSIAGVIATVGLVGAAIGAIASLRSALRLIADRPFDDVPGYWVLLRNLGLALGIGLALVVSAAATMIGTAGLDLVAQLLGMTERHPMVSLATRSVSIIVTFALDVVIIAVLFRVLSGVRATARALWPGALLGGLGLTVLQQLSGMFVGGASSNPLLATFASLVALLLWINLSAQVILIAAAYIVTGVEEHDDRVRARFGAETFAQRRVRRAEDAVRVATDELTAARAVEQKERTEA